LHHNTIIRSGTFKVPILHLHCMRFLCWYLAPTSGWCHYGLARVLAHATITHVHSPCIRVVTTIVVRVIQHWTSLAVFLASLIVPLLTLPAPMQATVDESV
jgi:hypothetical protein